MATAEMPLVTGTLCIMSEEGDTRIQWDKLDPEQVSKAQAKFDELKKKGYAGYSVNKKGDKGEVLHTFDPNSERVIMMPPMVGG